MNTKELVMDDEETLLLAILKKLDTVSDDVSWIKTDVAGLKTDVAELQYNFGVMSGRVDLLSESHLNLSRLVTQMNARLTALEDRYSGNGKHEEDE